MLRYIRNFTVYNRWFTVIYRVSGELVSLLA